MSSDRRKHLLAFAGAWQGGSFQEAIHRGKSLVPHGLPNHALPGSILSHLSNPIIKSLPIDKLNLACVLINKAK